MNTTNDTKDVAALSEAEHAHDPLTMIMRLIDLEITLAKARVHVEANTCTRCRTTHHDTCGCQARALLAEIDALLPPVAPMTKAEEAEEACLRG